MADVVYGAYSSKFENIDTYKALYNTIRLLSNNETIILLTYTPRREAEKQFFDLLSLEFCWTKHSAELLLPEHEIDNRIEIYHIHKSRWASVNSLSSHVQTPTMSNYLNTVSEQQNEQMKLKLQQKKSKRHRRNSKEKLKQHIIVDSPLKP